MSEQQPGGTVEDRDRCGSCGARVAVSQPWCTLCHTRLDGGGVSRGTTDPPPGDLARPLAPRSRDEPADADVSRPFAGGGDPGGGDLGGGDPAAGAPATLPPGAAEAMLAELAASTARGRPLAGGPLAGRSRGARTALAVGAALVLAAVGVGLLTLVGLLL